MMFTAIVVGGLLIGLAISYAIGRVVAMTLPSQSTTTAEQVLELALRVLVQNASQGDVSSAVWALRRPVGHSTLAERAAQLLEELEREEGER